MNAFSIFLGIGASFGLVCVAMRLRTGVLRQSVLDTGLGVLFGALLGGRIVYLITAWPYFETHQVEALQFWSGGYAWEGAVLGGLVVLLLTAALKRFSLASMADALLPLFPPLLVGIWLGSWQAGLAYGIPAGGAWWGIPAKDEWGAVALRFPVQALGATLTILVFGLIDFFKSRLRRPGQAASLAVVGIALELLGLSFLRADPALMWRGFRMDTWAAAGLVVIGLGTCLVAFRERWLPVQPKKEVEATDPRPLS